MSKIIAGKVFVVGDDVNTDEIIPARWCTTTDLDTLGPHALEDLHPSKSPSGLKFEPYAYDIIVAGENFGAGSSREVAPIALAVFFIWIMASIFLELTILRTLR